MPKALLNKFDIATVQRFTRITNRGCWEWTGSVFWDGYGQFSYKKDGKWHKARAHRVSYELYVSPPGDKHVCHKCDNPICVNPDHLFLGDQLANIADMDAKGRRVRVGLKGGTHPCASVSDEVAREIRAIRGKGIRLAEIAHRYGLKITQVKSIRSQRHWQHLTGDAA